MQIVKTIKIGKSSSNDFVINNDIVSRQHAILTVYDTGEVTIKDLNSTNGTFVDGKRITDTEPLKSGQVVRLGGQSQGVILDWQKLITTKPKNYRPTDAIEVKKIGKELDNDIRLPNPDVSRRHALLCKKQNGSISIVDCDSTNGTFVNGFPISGEKVLRSGDKVLIAHKYPLEWEKVFHQKPNPSPIWKWVAGIAATIALVVGLWYLIPKPEPEPDKELPASEIYAMYKKTVVMIYEQSGYRVTINNRPLSYYLSDLEALNYCSIDGDGDVSPGAMFSTGTGFFISSDGKIMTNRHVIGPTKSEQEKEAEQIKDAIQNYLLDLARRYRAVEQKKEANYIVGWAENVDVNYDILWIGIGMNDTHVTARTIEDLKREFVSCSVLKTSQDDALDVAIIQTHDKRTPDVVTHVVDLNDIARESDMELGDKVYTIGFPKGFTLGTTDVGLEANNQSGEITQERGEYTYGHNITIHQGASGSPVFDCHGRFAGIIVSGYLGISQGYNQAVQPQKAADFTK